MGTNSNDQGVSALFVGDTHFHTQPDRAEQVRQARFLEFLAEAREVEHLVLLGDIFDFWFDYPHFLLRGYEPLLRGLDGVREAGAHLHFVGGNHDIWAARYLHERYGTEAEAGPLTLAFDTTLVRCVHGDGMLGKELMYREFRSLVRSPAAIRFAKTLHPEALFAFSSWLSGTSRAANRDEADGIEIKAAHYLEQAVQENPAWELLVMGHVHHPFRIDRGPHTLLSLGGWLTPLNYGRFAGGVLEHAAYAPA
jgi:UDP-2,3-diacylglucosamine hydrolase